MVCLADGLYGDLGFYVIALTLYPHVHPSMFAIPSLNIDICQSISFTGFVTRVQSSPHFQRMYERVYGLSGPSHNLKEKLDQVDLMGLWREFVREYTHTAP